jgi:hypothetical protein
MDIAVNGIALCTPDDYTGCGTDHIPPLGRTFENTAAAVEKMMYDSYWQEGLSIILSERRVRTMQSLGLCPASWAKKLGQECGRPITNGSGRRTMLPAHFINGRRTKARAIRRYGPIENPVIGDVGRLIERFRARRGVPRSRLRIWKYDIAAAYQKLSYAVQEVGHVGVQLREGNFMFFLGGVFGLTSMPFAFNVITQAIVWELNHGLIQGDMLQYVDDGFVVSLDSEQEADVAATLGFIRGLLGDNAIAEHKLDFGEEFDFIGYHVSLTTGLITISRRNILKSIHAFGAVDLTPGARIPVRVMQRLASLGSRYGYICDLMRPFVRTLYSSYGGLPQQGFVVMDEGTRNVVQTFKNLFVVLGIKGNRFARSFESFNYPAATWICEFDASLEGIGNIWLERAADGTETARAWAQVDITSLDFGEDASYQNTAEYMGSLLCARGIAMLGKAGEPLLLRGDSVSALTWVTKGASRSAHATRAATMWAQYGIHHGINVVGTIHVSHDYNTRTDILSRQGTWAEVVKEDRKRYGGTLPSHLPQLDLQCDSLLQLVNPRQPLASADDFNQFFGQSMQFLTQATEQALVIG